MAGLDIDALERAERELERWLVAHADDGLSELVLVGLLRDYANRIDYLGYIPRAWGSSFSRTRDGEFQ